MFFVIAVQQGGGYLVLGDFANVAQAATWIAAQPAVSFVGYSSLMVVERRRTFNVSVVVS